MQAALLFTFLLSVDMVGADLCVCPGLARKRAHTQVRPYDLRHSLIWRSLFSPSLQQPEEITSRFNRAVALQRQGEWQEAAAEYRALLAAAPNYAEAQANLGVVLARLGNYEE